MKMGRMGRLGRMSRASAPGQVLGGHGVFITQ